MMHMWLWWGYDLGDFMFPGLEISARWSFALTWIFLFFFAMLFEGSKVFLARVQREAQRKLYPHRSDERRNLLCEGEQGSVMEATTSRNANSEQACTWKIRMLVNLYQSAVFVVHNVAGYLLMLAVMVYNVHLLLAVVLGMMLGYFLFGTKLTRLQMQCFRRRREVICTPECDDTAEGTTPPLLNASLTTEQDYYICQTRTCIQPSHYFKADGPSTSEAPNATCYYGAKKCPSKVAKFKPVNEGNSSNAEDVKLITEKQGCCKKTEPPDSGQGSSSQVEVIVHEGCCGEKEVREETPQVSCCHNAKTSDSQESIVQ